MYTVAFFKTGHQLLKVHILKTDQSFFPAEKVEVCNRFRLQMPVDQRYLLIRRQDETLRRVLPVGNPYRAFHQRRAEIFRVAISLHIELRSQHLHITFCGLDNKRFVRIASHLEISLSIQGYLPLITCKSCGIAHFRAGVQPDVRAVRQSQVCTLAGGDGDRIHGLAYLPDFRLIEIRSAGDGNGKYGGDLYGFEQDGPVERTGFLFRPGCLRAARQDHRIEKLAFPEKLLLVFGRGFQPGTDNFFFLAGSFSVKEFIECFFFHFFRFY